MDNLNQTLSLRGRSFQDITDIIDDDISMSKEQMEMIMARVNNFPKKPYLVLNTFPFDVKQLDPADYDKAQVDGKIAISTRRIEAEKIRLKRLIEYYSDNTKEFMKYTEELENISDLHPEWVV